MYIVHLKGTGCVFALQTLGTRNFHFLEAALSTSCFLFGTVALHVSDARKTSSSLLQWDSAHQKNWPDTVLRSAHVGSICRLGWRGSRDWMEYATTTLLAILAFLLPMLTVEITLVCYLKGGDWMHKGHKTRRSQETFLYMNIHFKHIPPIWGRHFCL